MTTLELDARKQIKQTPWHEWQHRCYHAAFMYLLGHPRARLHHGSVVGFSGNRHAHAWVETRKWLIDLTVPVQRFRREEWYGVMQPVTNVTYTRTQALAWALKKHNSGPWDSATSALPHYDPKKGKMTNGL